MSSEHGGFLLPYLYRCTFSRTKGARIACGRLVVHILRPPYLPLFIIIIFPFPQEEKPAPEASTDRHWNDLSHGENLFYRQTRNQLHAQQASQYTNQEEAGNKDQKLFHRGHFRLFHSNLLLYKSENFLWAVPAALLPYFSFHGGGGSPFCNSIIAHGASQKRHIIKKTNLLHFR